MKVNTDNKELTIRQVREIMGWSYPHTLRFAQRYGRQDRTTKRGTWLVPARVVEERVEEMALKSSRAQVMLWTYLNA